MHSNNMKNKASPADVLVSLRQANNDLQVVAGVDVDPSGFTLLAMLRNEMYFLPAFLAHYRGLGVERFVFLNDRSDDGTWEYLRQQPDVVVVQSSRSYGDPVEVHPFVTGKSTNYRVSLLWRSLLHDMFAQDKWALQVDLDEFVRLPAGTKFQDLIDRLNRQHARAVWGVMLDVYPRDMKSLAEQEKPSQLNISADWYFDGEKHLQLRRNRGPRVVHAGARARLYQSYGVDKLYRTLQVKTKKPKGRWLFNPWSRTKPLVYNALQKPILLKWEEHCYFTSSHNTNILASPNYLLPIQHFRFTGALYRKLQVGIREKSYHNHSADHRLLAELLRVMEAHSGSFLYRHSRSLGCFEDFSNTGNALGL